jgi:hypothetical protein
MLLFAELDVLSLELPIIAHALTDDKLDVLNSEILFYYNLSKMLTIQIMAIKQVHS